MTMAKPNISLEIKKSCTSEISKENQQDWAKIKSLPNRIEQVDKNRIQVVYITEDKSFYCQRLLTVIDGNLCYQDILIYVTLHKNADNFCIESQIEKEPKRFQKFIRTIIKGYAVIKIGKEIFSKYNNHEEEILQKYKSAKRMFEDYLEALKESL